jgi:hypothetical protein
MNEMDSKLATTLYKVLDAIDRGEIHLQDCLNQLSGERDELKYLLWEVAALKNVSCLHGPIFGCSPGSGNKICIGKR